MRAVAAGVLLTVVGFAAPAYADNSTALFKKYKCTKCHATDSRPENAPSYNEIMAKYKGKADAQMQLAKVVKDGGSDVRGEARMPANPYIPDTDVAAMVTWILKH